MWFTASSVTTTNNSNVVKINSNESIANVKPGDALIIGSFNPVEILKAYASDQGSFIQLTQAWTNATQSQVPALVLPTRSALNEAITAINGANKLVNDNYQAILDWQTKTGEVTFKGLDNQEVTVKTAKQLELDVKAVQPYPWAMRKIQFEAIRNQNLEKYEASGFVHFGKNHSSLNNINQGMYAYPDITNRLRLGRAGSAAIGESKTDYPIVNMAGVLSRIEYLSSPTPSYSVEIKFPPAEDGSRTYDSATGISVTHATPALAFAAETETNKVVTDRVDMWGFEPYLREINEADPFVYLYGLIQSRASSINGVATTDDNVRPITYFAWYEGDTTSRGRGVNWQTATEAQRIAIASDPKNNIYFDDATGKFYQWCVRGRSFAGLGNGDFSFVDPVQNSPMSFDYPNKSRIPVQGFNDTLGIVESGSNFFASTLFEAYNRNPHKGIFTAWSGSGYAINNECYFLVCGTVNRLNQGCYHPSFNRYGAAAFAWLNNPTTGQVSWSDTGNGLARKPTNSRMCFVSFDDGGSKTDLTGSGSIGVGYSGRPDGRYYDAIYASGQGGVCRDMRFKADGLSLAELAEHDLKIKSGEYRGVERLRKFAPKDIANNIYFYAANKVNFVIYGLNLLTRHELSIGDVIWIKPDGTTKFYSAIVKGGYPTYITADLLGGQTHPINDGAATATAISCDYWFPQYFDVSIAGEYLHADVFGPPDNILLSNDFKDGWVGSWVPQIPDGSPDTIKWTKPISALSSAQALVSDDNGASWVIGTQSSWFSSEVTNSSESLTIPIGRIVVATYKTKAKLTKPANVAAIHRSHAGIGNIFLTQNYLERDLCYSLTDNIIIRSSHALSESTVPLNDYGRLYEGKFYNASSRTFDMPSTFPLPDNNSPALMALNYAVEQNGMAFINYAYAELKFDSAARDWGCDGNVSMINGHSTMPDDNGNTVKVGTAQTEPLGWIKRAS